MGFDKKKKKIGSRSSSNDNLPICTGPWPSSSTRQEGDPWDDGFHTTVKQLVIVHGAGIDSIKFEYHDNSGTSFWSQKHGGSGGFKTDKIELDFPGEYLKSISGYYGSINDWSPVFIRSLTIESSRKKYGPFGSQQGTQFSFPATSFASKIVGFHGHSSWYLTSIGVYLEPVDDQVNQNIRPSKALMSSQLVTSQNFVSDFGTHDHTKGYSIVQGSSGHVQDNFNSNYLLGPSSTTTTPTSVRISKVMVKDTTKMTSFVNILDLCTPTYLQKGSSSNLEGVVSYGPWGGNGGSTFDDEVYTGIRQVNLTRSTALVSIEILYDRNGQPIWGNKNGGAGGKNLEKASFPIYMLFDYCTIVFDYPFESLTHITGFYGPLMFVGPTVIKSLTFHTTEQPIGNKKYGPFTCYSITVPLNGMVIGFHGRGGWFIDSIGVHVLKGKVSTTRRSLNTLFNANTLTSHNKILDKNPRSFNSPPLGNQVPNNEVIIVREPVPHGPGPWGGDGGKSWDDGAYTGIKQIHLTKREAIFSIQIQYDRDGRTVWSARHGGSGRGTTSKLKFYYPDEILTCITGYYGAVVEAETVEAIKSLTFYTTRRKYGPYGVEAGTFFSSTMTEGKVVGFHGRCSSYLDAIGVHMQNWLGNNQKPSKSIFSKIFK
ncbi:hypothetical protein MKX03_022117 [Papaver bracteatum]|nr:hypothetical protein MKX03_022117 [Papaver bracteatum]